MDYNLSELMYLARELGYPVPGLRFRYHYSYVRSLELQELLMIGPDPISVDLDTKNPENSVYKVSGIVIPDHPATKLVKELSVMSGYTTRILALIVYLHDLGLSREAVVRKEKEMTEWLPDNIREPAWDLWDEVLNTTPGKKKAP